MMFQITAPFKFTCRNCCIVNVSFALEQLLSKTNRLRFSIRKFFAYENFKINIFILVMVLSIFNTRSPSTSFYAFFKDKSYIRSSFLRTTPLADFWSNTRSAFSFSMSKLTPILNLEVRKTRATVYSSLWSEILEITL